VFPYVVLTGGSYISRAVFMAESDLDFEEEDGLCTRDLLKSC
jgi:hypothetical protein